MVAKKGTIICILSKLWAVGLLQIHPVALTLPRLPFMMVVLPTKIFNISSNGIGVDFDLLRNPAMSSIIGYYGE